MGHSTVDDVRLQQLQDALADAGVHVRRCHDCGGLQFSADATIPYCLCRKCGTADTRRVKRGEQLEWPWCAGMGAKT